MNNKAKMLAAALVSGLTASAAYGQAMVGAYYYPWYGDGVAPTVGHSWRDTLAYQLNPQIQPAAGYSASSNAATISAHIEQSLQANIGMWAMSWWGPNSNEDRNIRNSIFTNPNANKLQYSIMYESPGRFGPTSGTHDYSKLQSDFSYLADNVFTNPNYMRVNGRPVVFMYLTRVYFNTADGRQALADLRSMMQAKYGYQPYIVGDDVFGTQINTSRAAQFDAITTYDVYGASGAPGNNGLMSQTQINTMKTTYDNMESAAKNLGIDYIPAVTPGFNNRPTGATAGAAPPYLSNLGPAAQGSVLTSLLDTAALPNTDSSIKNLVMVTSFNEWHEATAIEATVPSPVTTTDKSASGAAYTQGYSYDGYGTRYIDILRLKTSGDIVWTKSQGNATALAANWATGFAPRYGDRAVFRNVATQTIDIGTGAKWGSVLLDGVGSTNLTGTGGLTLLATSGNVAIASIGTATLPQISVPIVTAGTIHAEGAHTLSFTKSVTAGRVEAFTGSSLTFDGAVTITDDGVNAVVRANAGSAMRFNAGLTSTATGQLTARGAGASYVSRLLTTNNVDHVVNLADGHRLVNLASGALQGNSLWARTNDNVTFDLNNFSDVLTSLRTDAGVKFLIDFGTASGANALTWQLPTNMSGTYAVSDFEIGTDNLKLGSAASTFTPVQLCSITINGIGYSATSLSAAYWNTDSSGNVQFYNAVPEPGTALLLALVGGASLRRRR